MGRGATHSRFLVVCLPPHACLLATWRCPFSRPTCGCRAVEASKSLNKRIMDVNAVVQMAAIKVCATSSALVSCRSVR